VLLRFIGQSKNSCCFVWGFVLLYVHVTGHADRVFREMTKMEKQASNVVDLNAVVLGFVAYGTAEETIERLQARKTENRKIIADFVRANKDADWKKLQKPIKAAVEALSIGLVSDKVGLLGTIKTCIEYGIMPTTLNADRLRKAKTWTTLDGKIVPNGYEKKHAPKVEAATPSVETTTPATKLEAFQKAVDSLIPPEPITDKLIAASTKPVVTQKAAPKGDIPRPNVSGDSEAPISAREHCAILLDQLFKNESFRSEFAPILATMLDSNVGIVTRCLVESRDLFCKGGK